MIGHAGTWLIPLLAMALLFAALPTSASALVVKESAKKSWFFIGTECGETSRASVLLPKGAFDWKADRPKVGDVFEDFDTEEPVAQITDISQEDAGKKRRVTWTAVGMGDVCANPDYYAEEDWITDDIPFRVTYRLREDVYFYGGFPNPRTKPDTFLLGANQTIRNVNWNSWGGETARGRGTFPANNCRPTCAEGSVTNHSVKVKLSKVKKCSWGRYRYRQLTYVFDRGAPNGVRKRVRINFGC
jgi:hypothetical protein